MAALEAASVPHMTDQARREVLGRYRRGAGTVTARSAAEALAASGIPTVYVPKEVK